MRYAKEPVGKRKIVCCRRCGMILLSAKSKRKGIGPGCEKKENREKQVKPYIEETPFIVTGNNVQQSLILDFADFSKGDLF
jgi:hypothetical protein